MPEAGTTEKRASILGSISGTLMLYGLFGLIVEGGLTVVVLQTEGTTRMVTLVGMLVILVLMVCFAGLNWESLRSGATVGGYALQPLWGRDHLPLAPEPEAAEGHKV